MSLIGQSVQEPQVHQVNRWVVLSLIGCCGGFVRRSQEHPTGVSGYGIMVLSGILGNYVTLEL